MATAIFAVLTLLAVVSNILAIWSFVETHSVKK